VVVIGRLPLKSFGAEAEDISKYIPRLVAALVSDSLMARSAADATLKDLFS